MQAPKPNSPEVEATTYAQLMHSVDTAPEDFERKMRTLTFLRFLNSSKYLLNEPGVRADIKRRIQTIAQQPQIDEYEMFLPSLCAKLATKGESIEFPGCRVPPISPAFRYIAKGSFGCVFKPALPNISANGQQWESYPNNVVKFFRKRTNLNRALRSAQDVYEELGHNDGHRLTPYKYKSYRRLNLGHSAVACNGLGDELYLARMPNLGVDFNTVYDYTFMNVAPYKEIHVSRIGAQIKKLLTQVVALQTNGKIHGDIRETNLMIKPNGIMTIVDFDWLFPNFEFYRRYYKSFGFYNNPPESLLFGDMQNLFLQKDNAANVRQIIADNTNPKKTEYVTYQNGFSFYQFFHGRKFNLDDIKVANEANFAHFKNLYGGETVLNSFRYACFSEMAKTFDSFGLAFCLLELLFKLYLPVFGSDVPNEVDKETLRMEITDNKLHYTDLGIAKAYNFLHALINSVLRPMVDWNMTRRKTAATALAELDALLVVLQTPGGGGRRTRRSKRSKGTRCRKN